MPQYRIDRQQTITSITKTDEGYLNVVAPIARTGVYKYLNSDGTITREYIPPQTLSNQDSINTLHLKPVTNNHPDDFVKSDSYQDLAVGSVGETAYYEDGKLYAKFSITVQDAIDSVNDGKTQLSPAYECDVEMKSGISPDGEHYDAIQTNRTYNHLAVVDKARGGDTLNFKMDSDSGVSVEINEPNNHVKGDTMPSVKIGGVDFVIDNEVVASHISDLTTKVDSAETAIKTEKAEGVKLVAKVDALKTELKDLKAEKMDSDKISDLVTAKLKLVDSATKILGEGKVDVADSDEAIMTSVVLKSSPDAQAKIDSYDGDEKAIYLKARFDSALDSFEDDDDEVAKNRKDLDDVKDEPKSDARQKHIDARQNKWKEGR